MFHPTRGGTRGGRDQFSWEDVKTDKDRENYLGNSLMAPVGRWQKGKDLTWYAKEKNSEEKKRAQQAELLKLKEAEADAMAIALGVKKKKTIESNVTKEEINHALNRDGDDSSEGEGEKGLGFGRNSRITMATGSNSVEIMNKGNDYLTPQATDSRPFDDTTSKKDKKKKKTKKHKHRHSRKHHRHSDSDEDDRRHASRRHASPTRRSRSPSPQRISGRHDRHSRREASPDQRYHRSKRTSRSRSPQRSRISSSRYSRSRSPQRSRRSSSRYSRSPPHH